MYIITGMRDLAFSPPIKRDMCARTNGTETSSKLGLQWSQQAFDLILVLS